MIIIAVILIVLGGTGLHFVERRRFYRRNHNGIQIFKSYRQSVIVGAVERLLVMFSGLLVAVGAVLLVGYLAFA